MWPSQGHLLAVGTPELREGAAVPWSAGRPMGQPWRLSRHKVFSVPPQPSPAWHWLQTQNCGLSLAGGPLGTGGL